MEPVKLKIRHCKLLPAVLICFGFSCLQVLGQVSDFIPDRLAAGRAFNGGDYETALKHYEALSERFTADPVYKYYAGACLVELKQEADRAKAILKEAIINSSGIRSVPVKTWYYLGRAYQLAGDYDLAIDAYDTFRESSRRREVRELGIDELIAMCEGQTGELKTDPPVAAERAEKLPERTQDPGNDYETLAREALEYQFRADSLFRLADRYRASLADLSESDKQSVRSKILSLEQSGFENQRMADLKYREAASLASEKYDEGDIPLTVDIAGEEDEPEPEPDASPLAADSIRNDTIEVRDVSPGPVLNLFDEEYEGQTVIPVNPELPDGLIYRIQLAAFRNPQEVSFFNGLGPISIYRAEGSDINFYYAGMFREREEAVRALVKVKQKGFNDAFIIALMDGSRVSMEKAEQLENQWSRHSLFKQDTLIAKKETEPPTLVYRVEVLKADKKAKDDELEMIEKLADKRSFDIFETADKQYVYLIGKFLTFESAAAYADLLYRNGMKEAKVVAYLGAKEIPLETARQLFELYFEK
ncbi:MAG: hypothetical protein KFF49_00735 [Bacteroidales bacterium]|nr:hypothetical protein [Bacteroidales bacterium]